MRLTFVLPEANATMKVLKSHTVDEVKDVLYESFELKPNEIRLVYNGRDLVKGHRSMGQYKVRRDAILHCKTMSQVWTKNNFVLSQVASFLCLRDVVKIMSVLSSTCRLIGDVALSPSPHHLRSIVRRAKMSCRRVNLGTLRWKNLGRGADIATHTQMATLPELSMLHHLLKSIPVDLLLVNGRTAINRIGQGHLVSGFCNLTGVEPGAMVPCTLSAQIQNKSLGVEVNIESRLCIVDGCTCVVLRACPCCNQIRDSCSKRGHYEVCDWCTKKVCQSCVILEQEEAEFDDELTVCNKCGFRCFACSAIIPLAIKYLCSAGDDCASQNSFCCQCVFDAEQLETDFCEVCDKTWCVGCVQFPACSFCDGAYCDECSDMIQCSRCNNMAHRQHCARENGNSCEECEVYICDTCEQMEYCVNEDCCSPICAACRDELAVMCPAGHMTCKDCVEDVNEQCAAREAEWGGVVENKSCWVCWQEAFAQLKGFDNADAYKISKYHSIELNNALQGSPLLQKRVQYWWLNGHIYHPDTTSFDLCSFLPTKLASMSAEDKADPRLIDELVAALAVTHVFVSSSAAFVNGISCVNIESPCESSMKMPVGHHGDPAKSTLTLDEGERIVSVHVRCGNVIDSLRLVTSAGRDVTYGGPGGDKTTNYRVPAGWRLAGFFGGVGGHLHNLGVVIAEDPA